MPESSPADPHAHTNQPNPSIYNRFVLYVIYTIWVHWISHPLAWGISNRWIRHAYRTRTGRAHLSIGPGNGRFLRHLPARVRALHLMDLNPQCLGMATRILGRRPITVHGHWQDVLAAWKDLPDHSVDSIDCMMVIHTLRGALLQEKLLFLAEAHRVLKSDGVFYGATILASGQGVQLNAFARLLMRIYNGRKNIFANTGDTFEDLRTMVRAHFPDADVGVQGCTGIWVAVKR